MKKCRSIEELGSLMDSAFRDVAQRLRLTGPILSKVNNVCFSVAYTGSPYGVRFCVEMMDGYIAPVLFLSDGGTPESGYYNKRGKRQAYDLYEAFGILSIDERSTWDKLKAMYNTRSEYQDVVAVMAPMIERHWSLLITERERLFCEDEMSSSRSSTDHHKAL